MAIPSEMTVSISKGKTNETSTAHNNRKTRLKNASSDKVKKFYGQTGHKHIHQKYTDLNEDYIRNPKEMYDQLFEKSILEYNSKQKRKDRKIGKGLALTVKEKQGKIALLTMVHKYKQIKSKKKQQEFLKDLAKKQPEMAKSLKDALPNFENVSLRDTHKLLTQAKHAKTLGEALYDKQKKSRQANTHVEFIFQVGSAEDFNEMENGRIKKSYDRRDPDGIWQKSKRVLKKFEKQFEKENPNLVVVNWSIHMDESTPHMHLEAIPFAETAKTMKRGKKHKGLSVKPSFDGALECEGFKRDQHDSRKAFKTWQNREADTLTKIMKNELGITRKKGYTNRIKDVHEYKKVKENLANQREKANNYKKIADKNAIFANQNYEIYQKNAEAVKTAQDELENVTRSVSEARKKLSDVSKERQRQLALLSQEIAQKRSERLRELSNEMKEKHAKEEKKLKAREDAVKQRETKVKSREKAVTVRETDVNALQYGGVDSKGIKHKSIQQRVKEGIEYGVKQFQKALMHPLKAFTYAYRKSMVEQAHPTYTKEQVKKLTNIQENYLAKKDGGSKVQILREMSSDRFEKQSVKAIGVGTKALAKALPSYDAVSEAITDAILLDQLENEEKQHKQEQKQQDQPKQTPTVSKDEDSPDF